MRSVCLCGSKRFKKEMTEFAQELEAAGVIVFEPSFGEPVMEDAKFESKYIKDKVFKGLTLEHFDWIRKADICFVFNKDDYAGVSVSLEMGYAAALGKPTFALSKKTGDPCRDALIDKEFDSAKTLLRVL